MKIFAIESSCDEFAAAVVEDGHRVLAETVFSQVDIHKAYGGVVPEVAARSHLETALPVVDECLSRFRHFERPSLRHSEQSSYCHSGLDPESNDDIWNNIDAIAVTSHPGLIGSLMIGTLTARVLALLKKKPLYAVDHILGHVYANFLIEDSLDCHGGKPLRNDNNSDVTLSAAKQPGFEFPLLALVVSGGHTQLMLFKSHGDYEIIGETVDDAVGEAFDKVAKILGLPYPGGPAISAAAETGDPLKYRLPHPKLSNPLNFSFSGLKTALLRAVQHEVGVDSTFPSAALSERLTARQVHDFAASFERTAVEILVEKLAFAVEKYHPRSAVLAGGVAANKELRRTAAEKLGFPLSFPPLKWCGDNGAMIGAAAYFGREKFPPVDPWELNVEPNK